MADSVSVFEVGPRDGLQNEGKVLSTELKIAFIQKLIGAGLREIEMGAFVREDRVPQMADTDQLYERLRAGQWSLGRARAWSLVPNQRGLERAIACGAKAIAIFTAASDTFARKNIGMTVDESLREFAEVAREAKRRKIPVRGYVSTAFGCPYEGKIAPAKTLKTIEKLADLGVIQVSIGDTIGVGDPRSVEKVVKPALRLLGRKKTAVHFHDTRGTALANTLRALDLGVRSVDASAGGLGGCPYAPGASGNLATEDLVYMLHGMGMKTGVDLDRLCDASLELNRFLNRDLPSRYLRAYQAKKAAS